LTDFRLLIFYAEFVVLRVILLPEIHTLYGLVNLFVFQSLATLAIASHLRTMLTDPVSPFYGHLTLEDYSHGSGESVSRSSNT
jgi:palmitoyltransferase